MNTLSERGHGGADTVAANEAWYPALPLFLLLKNRRTLVVGCDEVARDRVAQLLQTGAQVAIIGEELHPQLQLWLEEGKIAHAGALFHPDQLTGIWLVVNCLEDEALRLQLWNETQARCIFLNTVDVNDRCSAYWPALIQRPPVTVAIGTGGASPALAGYLRHKIASILPDNFQPLVTWLHHWRKWITSQIPQLDRRAILWRSLMKNGLVELFLANQSQEAERMIQERVQMDLAQHGNSQSKK
ncbi:MAG: bifunctional precorrin-2 dehydrogenase/sirohydrochlorin ferrochelatase [Magnetococcales bacterium]|nr:bifunctional precorrin-2 dehydrogenase/sirohydrochlorin ferrochelatase [Magnetococcales bacterium]NGZ26428.1 bifunctional precorrin-2 dehydrogenase/sirohydrochlorin ferrochelatase [Magnetococcales bacterium]